MTHLADIPDTEPRPSRRTRTLVQVGIPVLLVAGAVAGVLVAANQPTGQPVADTTPQTVAVAPATTAAAPTPKPTATAKPVVKAKAKAAPKPAPKTTTAPAPTTPEAQAAPEAPGSTDTGAQGQAPQAASAPVQGNGNGNGSGAGASNENSGSGWTPAAPAGPAAPAAAAPAPVPKPVAPQPAPVQAPAAAPQVQENHYPAQTFSSINAARMGLGAPGFVPYTAGCSPVATAWASSLDGAEGYVQHPDVVGYRLGSVKIAGTFSLDGQVNGRSGTLTVYTCA